MSRLFSENLKDSFKRKYFFCYQYCFEKKKKVSDQFSTYSVQKLPNIFWGNLMTKI